jgi:hypothetical protein
MRKKVHTMTNRKAANGLDFEALQLGIERCDPDLVLGFYAEDAQLSIVNALTPHASPFELCGKAEIAKHLRAIFGQEASHRVEREDIVGEDRVTFREACEYSDGGRIVVETTLEVRDGKIVRQVDVVARDTGADSQEEFGRSPPIRRGYPRTRPEVDAPQPDRLPRLQRPIEKEDLR